MSIQQPGLVSVALMGATISGLAKRSMKLDPHLARLQSGWWQNQLPSTSSRKLHSCITELQLVSVYGLARGCNFLRPFNLNSHRESKRRP